eukprot:331349-Prymnesium_polylepis.1
MSALADVARRQVTLSLCLNGHHTPQTNNVQGHSGMCDVGVPTGPRDRTVVMWTVCPAAITPTDITIHVYGTQRLGTCTGYDTVGGTCSLLRYFPIRLHLLFFSHRTPISPLIDTYLVPVRGTAEPRSARLPPYGAP